jgi:L-histidine N-alpha-methyltransferase
MISDPTCASARGDTERIRIDHHLAPADESAVQEELRHALAEAPRRIPTKYFYDDHGSVLFERICELPEYYQTRTESALLHRIADQVVALSDARELVELGSGASTKSRILLDALAAAGHLESYVPVDVSEGIVRRVANELVSEYPTLTVHGLIADFMTDLGALPSGVTQRGHHRLVAFLGGTIGNLDPAQEGITFLRHVHDAMAAGDHLLIGVDLIKDISIIEAAYNDRAGVTAAFNLNVLSVLNRRFGADFVLERFRHRAFFNRQQNWIEMRLVSRGEQHVRIEALDLDLDLRDGEELLTEISVKFDRQRLGELLDASGFDMIDWYVQDGLFALGLATPRNP